MNDTEIFKRGDRIAVKRVRHHLAHHIGDIATVIKGNYGGADAVIDVKWETGLTYSTTVFANQFELLVPDYHPTRSIEDTREYLNAITGETNA